MLETHAITYPKKASCFAIKMIVPIMAAFTEFGVVLKLTPEMNIADITDS